MPAIYNGSTAPTITSPELAWPARPIARPSPLSTPSTERFDDSSTSYYPSRQASSSKTISLSPDDRKPRKSSIKGKEKAFDNFELRIQSDQNDDEEKEEEGKKQIERNYGPPKKPLPPNQLGRIAQSFGIIIPNLPQSLPNSDTINSPNSRRPISPASPSLNFPTIPLNKTKGGLSPTPLSKQPPTRSTPFLLSVIPPLCLLPPQSSTSKSPEEIRRRDKKWRRGRLLPLQPTLGSMLVCIAREYGLPSTIGISIYLVLPGRSKKPSRGLVEEEGSSSSAESSYTSSDIDEPSGPLISSSTWSTLFSSHLIQLASGRAGTTVYGDSRSSTPSQTPIKNGLYDNNDPMSELPPSPSSMIRMKTSTSQPTTLYQHKHLMRRSKSTEPPELTHSHSSNLSTSSSSASNILPPTPASASLSTITVTNFSVSSSSSNPAINPIVGTIEFDIDTDEAIWFENFRSSSRSRSRNATQPHSQNKHKRSLTSENGMKELSLVNKVSDERPRFIKDLDVDDVVKHDEHDSEETHVEVDSQQDVTLISSNTEEGEHAINGDSHGDMLKADDKRIDDLLASPINLAPDEKIELDQTTRLQVQEILDKRGSGLVMAEQLDDLEKMMRQLSPREIRLTSPRLLTPRMAAKVANLTLPAVPRRSNSKTAPTSSPLAGGFTSPNPDEFDGGHAPEEEESDKSQPHSARSNGTFGSNIHLETKTQPELEDNAVKDEDQFQPPRPAWPAVKHGSPGSPTINEYFSRPSFSSQSSHLPSQAKPQQQRNVSSPASIPISSETLQRMKDEQESSATNSNVTAKSSDWIPRRPARPPSPKLENQPNLSHTLSPELVDFLHRSPPPNSDSINSPSNNGVVGIMTSPEERKRSRSGSISLKGLRNQMSAKNLGQMFKHHNSVNDNLDNTNLPSPPLPKQKETIGLFKSGLPSENEMKFGGQSGFINNNNNNNGAGIRSVSSPIPNSANSEFGPPLSVQQQQQASSPEQPSQSHITSNGSGNGKSKFTSRIWGFRNHSDKNDKDKTSNNTIAKGSKRNPSIDGSGSIKISEPITSTFIHKDSFDSAANPNPNINMSMPDSANSVNSLQQQQQIGLGHGRLPSSSIPISQNPNLPTIQQQPASPNPNPSPNPQSPRSIKRKPVPGSQSTSSNLNNLVEPQNPQEEGKEEEEKEEELIVKNSMSLNSMASFVLEDAPRGRRGGIVSANTEQHPRDLMLGQAK
ncbi:uncharacterized protein L201_007996 [Kwoniella dendrophila CBS 6074]|uniref:Uncharacterized protein n=1 Tax=Kwoniella dendrophila CBS 6074 TaxID=1295534 RepID=A0AAX4K5V0_9TREE